MKIRMTAIAVLSAVLGGCAISDKIVYVRDQHGQPIEEVRVISQYEAVDAGMNMTNADGRCCVNLSRSFMLGYPKYLAFVKEGCQTEVIRFPRKWPFTIHLKPAEDPQTAPASRPKDDWQLPPPPPGGK
ncbi:MAG: hypothetical protein HZA50_02660 [Planctomycetes bacterium]|nr:hypothetical protein [Planctomycetota bacterium]